ncbi:MAG TPA: T9SS type A sorting domain-containing protein, partial [Rhodothermales bacterium]|nr:T9SS type A sorting domain-containing protein [Rhodothermales bacterium]
PDNDYESGPRSTYRRTVLFVHDPDAPYLIDLNAATGPAATPMRYAMRYHGNAEAMSRTPDIDDYAMWQGLWAKDNTASKTDANLFLHPFSVEYPLKATTTTSDAQETLAGPRAIMRLHVESGPAGFNEAQDHTTVAFIRALPGGGEPATRPLAGSSSQNGPQTWRFFTWQHDAETVDVFAARSAIIHREPGLRADEVLGIATPTGTVRLAFDAEDDYGFARLRYDGTRWAIDPVYQHQLRLEGGNPVAIEQADVPEYFRLDANVPNPFSETTEIRFALPWTTHVTLAIYDLNGREVARLLDAQQSPGYHSVTWDASHFASGVYLARLTAGAFIETQRLVLQK